MSACNETEFLLLRICLTSEDFYLLVLNVMVFTSIAIMTYVNNYIQQKRNQKLFITIKHNFTLLGEGLLSYFYSSGVGQQKNTTLKKKVIGKSDKDNKQEKPGNHNELKCNLCGRTVELTYHNTLPKLSS